MNNRKKGHVSLRRLILAPFCVASIAVSVQAQQAPAPAGNAAEAPKANVPVEKVAVPSADDVIELSPFEVTSDANGYYQANSMSGTRFNTKIEDLASSISIVTKEQMSDFAMLDINDIFLYTAGAEGTGTYTSYTVDRNGSVQDDVQLNPTQANRIRGIGSANVSLGNFETMGRNPIDSALVESVEVSRGPNASVFGLGQASGTVNMVPISANLTRNRTRLELRADSYDGYRASIDHNQVLLKNKLAVRVSAIGQHDGFVRKPSGVNTVRYTGMIKYQPFKSTTITASYGYYKMNGNRPNFSPPRDSVSYWIQSGKPTWDPIAQVIHVGGSTLGPFTGATGIPDYFSNSFTGSNHSFAFVDQNGLGYFGLPVASVNTWPLFQPSLSIYTTGAGTRRFLTTTSGSGIAGGRLTTQPLFVTTPTVSDKSIYNWEDINIASVNRQMDKVMTYNFALDQFFFNTPTHMMVGQFAAMREDAWRYQRNLIGVANDNGQSGQLFIDINEKLLTGEVNPYFLRPYIGTDQPRTTWQPSKWDTYRGQLMYKLDLSRESGALKWFGTHQVSGYYEYKYRINKRYSYKDAMNTDPKIGNLSLIPGGVPRGNQGAVGGGAGAAPSYTRMYWRYYMGDNQGNDIDYGPTDFQYGMYNFNWGGDKGMVSTPIGIGQVAVTDATGAGNNTKTILKTRGGVLHSQWFKGLVVTTFGLRDDKQYSMVGSGPQQLLIDGMTFDLGTIDHWSNKPWKVYSGKTKTSGVVVRPFRDLPFVAKMQNESGAAGFFGDVLKGFSFRMNKSDSFIPMDPKVNLRLEALPNTTGEGKDYGFTLSLLDDRMVVRYNHYETKQINAQNGDASTVATRTARFDVASDKNYRLPVILPVWLAAQNPSWTTDQIERKTSEIMGLDHDYRLALRAAYDANIIASTNDITAKGDELEVFFNPTKYWTISGSATKTESISSNVSQEVAEYIAERTPFWMSIHDENDPTKGLWWDAKKYDNSQYVYANYAQFISTPYAVIKEEQGKSKPQIRKYAFKVSTNLQLSGITDNKILKRFGVGGAIRWEDKGAIGYYGLQSLPATITDLDATRPIYDKAHYYFDVFFSYKTKLWANKIATSIKLNVQNIQEGGRLQAIGAFPDGTPHTYRIVDPRKFILTVAFDI